jgi:hypothetical protein
VKSTYWTRARPDKAERETEAQHKTRFGDHWVNLGKPTWTSGRLAFRESFPPRVGPGAPNRWAAAPAGLPLYECRQWAALAAPPNPHITHGQRIRDWCIHLRERAYESGTTLLDKPTAGMSVAEHARALMRQHQDAPTYSGSMTSFALASMRQQTTAASLTRMNARTSTPRRSAGAIVRLPPLPGWSFRRSSPLSPRAESGSDYRHPASATSRGASHYSAAL